jgi:hypothetical protein
MKRLLPSRTELAFFAALAIVAAGVIEGLISGGTLPRDLMMALLALPVFVTAAVMGLRRSPQWAPVEETEEPVRAESTEKSAA